MPTLGVIPTLRHRLPTASHTGATALWVDAVGMSGGAGFDSPVSRRGDVQDESGVSRNFAGMLPHPAVVDA